MSQYLCDLIPLRTIPPVIFALICYPMVGLQDLQSRFLVFILVLDLALAQLYLAVSSNIGSLILSVSFTILLCVPKQILTLVNVVAATACLCISALSSSIGQANFISVIFFITSMVFGGKKSTFPCARAC